VSKPTVKKIIDFYLEKGLLREAGKGQSTEEGGKKPSLFIFNKDFGCVLSIHLGPDFVYGAVTDLHGDIVHSLYTSLDTKDFDEIFEFVVSTIRDLSERVNTPDTKIIGISLALPGVVDVATGFSIFSPHFVEWGTDIPFQKLLEERLRIEAPIHLENVNRLQAYAEGKKGKAVGKRNFVIVDAIYEGLGAGIVFNGELYEGSEYLSGEVGHMVLMPDNGPECICGGRGCFEALVSLNRIHKQLREYYEENSDSLIYSNTNRDAVTIEDLLRAYKEGDSLAEEIMNDIIKWFAIGLNNVIMVYDPEMIILQGIYSEAGPEFLEQLRSKINQMSLPYLNRKVEIVFSDFGKERGVIGGAVYTLDKYFEKHSL
jgi:predicted NBD/HSP70 family sugar kinase